MSGASFSDVRRAIERADVAPVYYLTGEEDILKGELVRSVIEAVVDDASRDFNVDVRTAGDVNAEDLHTLVETPPMLADRRVVVIRGLEQWRRNSKVWQTLLDYLARPSPTTALVLTAGPGQTPDKTLIDRCVHVAVAIPDREAASAWAARHAERLGLTLSPAAASHLMEAVGGSLSFSAIELDKLAAAAEPGSTIEVADIERFVGVRHGETLSDWVDAVSRRDLPSAIQLLDIVLAQPGSSAVKMLNALGTTFVAARLTRSLADQRNDARQVRDALWRFLKRERPRGVGRYSEEIERWIATARKWRSAELDGALRLLFHTDESLKTTTISDARATLATMLLRLRLLGQPT